MNLLARTMILPSNPLIGPSPPCVIIWLARSPTNVSVFIKTTPPSPPLSEPGDPFADKIP